jgi:hypothetical protein
MYNTNVSFDSIVIIESLKPGDLRSGRDLFETTIAEATWRDETLYAELHTPANRTAFLASLDEVVRMTEAGRTPILQIETHGSERGIGLTDGDTVPWSDVAPRLLAMNTATRMVAAMCHGAYMAEILRPVDRAPAFGIVGSVDALNGGPLLEMMQRFYQILLSTQRDLGLAFAAANETEVVRDWSFRLTGAEIMLCRVFKSYLAPHDSDDARRDRVNELVASIAIRDRLDVAQTAMLRTAITEDISDREKWFAHYREKFLMLDLFPENEDRVPLRLDDCS